MKISGVFLSEKNRFFGGEISINLNRRVFVMFVVTARLLGPTRKGKNMFFQEEQIIPFCVDPFNKEMLRNFDNVVASESVIFAYNCNGLTDT